MILVKTSSSTTRPANPTDPRLATQRLAGGRHGARSDVVGGRTGGCHCSASVADLASLLTASAATSSGISASCFRLYAARSKAWFIGVGGGQLGDHAAAEDDDRPVADKLDLLQLGRVDQDRRVGTGQVAQQAVDLALGPDVDAARGVEAQHRLDAAGYPARNRHLLLVAAGQPAHLGAGARVDLQRLDRVVDVLALLAQVDQPPVPNAGAHGQADVLAHVALHEQSLRAVRGDVDQPGTDGVRRMAERDGLALDQHLAGAGALRPGEYVEQLVLALAFEGHDAQHFARVKLEADVVQVRTRREALHRQARRRRSHVAS